MIYASQAHYNDAADVLSKLVAERKDAQAFLAGLRKAGSFFAQPPRKPPRRKVCQA